MLSAYRGGVNRKEGNGTFIIILIRKWASFIWHYFKSYCQFLSIMTHSHTFSCLGWVFFSPPRFRHQSWVSQIVWRLKSYNGMYGRGDLSMLSMIKMQEGEEVFKFQVSVGTNINGCKLGHGYFWSGKISRWLWSISGMQFWKSLLVALKVWMGTYGRVPVTATIWSDDSKGPSVSVVFFHALSYSIMIFFSSWLLC